MQTFIKNKWLLNLNKMGNFKILTNQKINCEKISQKLQQSGSIKTLNSLPILR